MSQNSQQVTSSDTVKMVVKSNQAANGNVHHIATIGTYISLELALIWWLSAHGLCYYYLFIYIIFFFSLEVRGIDDGARLGGGATSIIYIH